MTIKVTPTAPLPATPMSRPAAPAPAPEPSVMASPKGQPRLDPDWANVTADHGGVADVELGALSLPVVTPTAGHQGRASTSMVLTEEATAPVEVPVELPILAEDGGSSRTSGSAGGGRRA